MIRVGCLFGTFDPPHLGHVAIAQHMLSTQDLDQVWLVITPQNPFKKDRQLSADRDRLAMVRLALHDRPGLFTSGVELDMPRPNYTVDSLRFMRQRWPDHHFDLIIGSDNLGVFHEWKGAEDILEHHRLLVYPRAGFEEHLAGTIFRGHPGIRIVADAPMLSYSSTEVRESIREMKERVDLVDPAVLAYIRQHGLYKP